MKGFDERRAKSGDAEKEIMMNNRNAFSNGPERSRVECERGAALIDTAVVIALVCIVALAGIRGLGRETADVFCRTTGYLSDADKEVVFTPWMFRPGWGEGPGGGEPCVKRSKDDF